MRAELVTSLNLQLFIPKVLVLKKSSAGPVSGEQMWEMWDYYSGQYTKKYLAEALEVKNLYDVVI